ncbi:MAG: hypothetical protein HC767_05045 [Akkermansiaceae bacterium]|nr:hypothetical protein [Akkermansiaceae bacterium]
MAEQLPLSVFALQRAFTISGAEVSSAPDFSQSVNQSYLSVLAPPVHMHELAAEWLQVLDNTEHDETACSPGCCLQHAFCTLKLSVPNLETRSQVVVEVCVDLPMRLRLGSFASFANSNKVEDSWLLLAAGQSSELAMLSQMLGTTSAQHARSVTRGPSRMLYNIPTGKHASSGALSLCCL